MSGEGERRERKDASKQDPFEQYADELREKYEGPHESKGDEQDVFEKDRAMEQEATPCDDSRETGESKFQHYAKELQRKYSDENTNDASMDRSKTQGPNGDSDNNSETESRGELTGGDETRPDSTVPRSGSANAGDATADSEQRQPHSSDDKASVSSSRHDIQSHRREAIRDTDESRKLVCEIAGDDSIVVGTPAGQSEGSEAETLRENLRKDLGPYEDKSPSIMVTPDSYSKPQKDLGNTNSSGLQKVDDIRLGDSNSSDQSHERIGAVLGATQTSDRDKPGEPDGSGFRRVHEKDATLRKEVPDRDIAESVQQSEPRTVGQNPEAPLEGRPPNPPYTRKGPLNRGLNPGQSEPYRCTSAR